jgi:hypothetical protein
MPDPNMPIVDANRVRAHTLMQLVTTSRRHQFDHAGATGTSRSVKAKSLAHLAVVQPCYGKLPCAIRHALPHDQATMFSQPVGQNPTQASICQAPGNSASIHWISGRNLSRTMCASRHVHVHVHIHVHVHGHVHVHVRLHKMICRAMQAWAAILPLGQAIGPLGQAKMGQCRHHVLT